MSRQRLTIDHLGAQGDGVARLSDREPVYVPYTLPGEVVEAEVHKGRARHVKLVETASQRQKPACRHFTKCGGCSVQHLDAATYAAWKRDKLVRALAARGIEADIAPLVPCSPGSRRRVSLTALRVGKSVLLGFNAPHAHTLVDIFECPVAAPEIVAALDALRRLAGAVAATPKPFQLHVTATRTGLDIAVEKSGRLSPRQRGTAVDCAIGEGFARLTLDGELIVESTKPVVRFGSVPVIPPPAGFLQAVESAEEAMAALVTDHLRESRHCLDLFAGSGTFALRLAQSRRVHAVEGEQAALTALDQAARNAAELKPVSVEKRNLFHRPLSAKELDRFDGLVFDPPRAGAEDQCRQMAKSKIKRIAAVSCNPGTLARDLAILVEGGYRVTRVVPIDQFLWSPHVEAVALLERGR